ncbi:MarR family transcriptional regulator [Solirubrobacter phytolaccae]|uniref:MarR family transcriptional regulator n=1 Tax=Solirubrobacter phytolaccae TaxID=1404360 RepID=A0A9X3N6P8_9ACTN|nr:MarR family transcriptional regulator [Solirubrobacter phytolaccae]MDA0180865.1 MarR family transcriptional regulator [Solirubrobacter phytolaccae]
MPDEVARFIERFAGVLVEGGMPRMPARVFTALLASDGGRLTAAELADKLQVSPAAVSGAVRYLVQTQLVEREREPGSRRDVYRLGDDPWYEAIYRREALITRWERALSDGVAAVGEDTPAGHRLQDSASFFAFLGDELPGLLARWRERE